ncbi:MAG TPA: hypothetical protein DCQ64_15895 [Candidatus Rokubacteria bacterium]|nr:hypothetical protein [Candidatus Rokubacteria bacterium]
MSDLHDALGGRWELGRYDGDAHQPAFSFRYRRADGRDRLTVADWQERIAREKAADVPAVDRERTALLTESEAMAGRMVHPDSAGWTAQALLDLFLASPPAWQWLSRLLWPFAYQENEDGSTAGKLDARSRLLAEERALEAEIRRVRSAIAETV